MKAISIAFGLLPFVLAAAGPTERTAQVPQGEFRVVSDVVLINATVLDGHDRPVRGLPRDQFRIFEDKAEQNIAYFSEEEVPLSLAVIFDTSGSMDGKLPAMRSALASILQSANAQDEFALITFANEPQIAVGWTRDPGEIQNRALVTGAHGQTSLLDALETGLSMVKKAHNARKAIVIFSDGGDNHSRASEREVLQSFAEADVQIYAIDSMESTSTHVRAPEELMGPDLLDRLTDRVGGRYFQVDGGRELQRTAEQIGRELRSQYLIGYVPLDAARDGRFHHVRVQLSRQTGSPKLNVFWRHGYRSAGE
ncbi:MAG TPA: VWA domain-containing protein [Bryobacteraceae bacterium]|nr:VWA domain-containing protein [Bryobacteraceae bacterium]